MYGNNAQIKVIGKSGGRKPLPPTEQELKILGEHLV
jgi:hypothetical protein